MIEERSPVLTICLVTDNIFETNKFTVRGLRRILVPAASVSPHFPAEPVSDVEAAQPGLFY